ncbi:MAG: zinc-dependent peptidase [Flavobacteriales bacterium]|nr:zinc-dependent peptidase [Flavobacteriales bacterium]
MSILLALLALGIVAYFMVKYRKKDVSFLPLPDHYPNILEERVAYYRALSVDQKRQFESDMNVFLHSVTITGVSCEVDDVDRVLVGASATIPLFGFPFNSYPNLSEVLLYANRFTSDHEIGPRKGILGMVGTGYMSGTMILSKPDLRSGFLGQQDARNVGIHEFSHLVDMSDGEADGIPDNFLKHPYSIQWVELLRKKIEEIAQGKSDINPYALTGKEEFFAVASEYFFEDAGRMAKEHPDLHSAMINLYRQNPTSDRASQSEPRRNDPCPCGSGLKYKKCCGQSA